MNPENLPASLGRIRRACRAWPTPAVTQISRSGSPFRVLVSTLISLRTRDEVTEAASDRLFALADDPDAFAAAARPRPTTLRLQCARA